MKKKSGRIFLIAAVLFACWLQYPVGMHVREAIPGVRATCVGTGLTEGKKCKLCGKLMRAQQVIPATGLHSYDDDFDKSCNNCSYIREVNCSFEFVNYRVALRDEDTSHKNWRVIVYKLGDQTVKNPSDEEALQAIDGTAKTYWGIAEINRLLLTDAGNYVVLLKYNAGPGAAIKVPMVLTINDDPKLVVDENNRINVIDKNPTNKNHALTVFYLQNATVIEPENETDVKNAAISTKTYTDLTEINELMIAKEGNYVFYLRYETADGVARTVTLTKTLKSRPELRVDGENRLVVECDDETLTNFRAFVYYLGDQPVTDIYDEIALEGIAGGYIAYWGLHRIEKAVLSEPGTYVIHLHYNIENGHKKTVALRVTI